MIIDSNQQLINVKLKLFALRELKHIYGVYVRSDDVNWASAISQFISFLFSHTRSDEMNRMEGCICHSPPPHTLHIDVI